MRIRLGRRGGASATGAFIVALLAVATPTVSEAKVGTWVLTGGELGTFAVNVNEYVLGIEEFAGLPGPDATEVEAPARRPAVYYDLYPSSGVFHVAVQQHDGGADLRYYPDGGLLEDRRPYDYEGSAELRPKLATDDGPWYELTEEALAFMDAAIAYGLTEVQAGEAEANPVASDWRWRGMTSAQYLLRPHPSHELTREEVDGLYGRVGLVSGPPAIEGGVAETFIMTELLETMSRRAVATTNEMPAVVITLDGHDWGGVFGAYTPPEGDEPGRLWVIGYSADRPYYETTPGLDAIIAQVLGGNEPVVETAEDTRRLIVFGGLVAALAGGAWVSWLVRRRGTTVFVG